MATPFEHHRRAREELSALVRFLGHITLLGHVQKDPPREDRVNVTVMWVLCVDNPCTVTFIDDRGQFHKWTSPYLLEWHRRFYLTAWPSKHSDLWGVDERGCAVPKNDGRGHGFPTRRTEDDAELRVALHDWKWEMEGEHVENVT